MLKWKQATLRPVRWRKRPNQTKQDVHCYETRCGSDSRAQSRKNLAPKKKYPPAPRDSPPPPNPPGRSLGSINHVASSRHPTPHQEQRLVSDSLLGSQTVAPRISLDFMHFKWTLHLKVIDLIRKKQKTKLCWSKKCLRFWSYCKGLLGQFFSLKEEKKKKKRSDGFSSNWLKFVDMQCFVWIQRFHSGVQISITPPAMKLPRGCFHAHELGRVARRCSQRPILHGTPALLEWKHYWKEKEGKRRRKCSNLKSRRRRRLTSGTSCVVTFRVLQLLGPAIRKKKKVFWFLRCAAAAPPLGQWQRCIRTNSFFFFFTCECITRTWGWIRTG